MTRPTCFWNGSGWRSNIVVGLVAARVGQLVLTWRSSRWIAWLQVAAALLIVCVGLVLTVSAWRTVTALPRFPISIDLKVYSQAGHPTEPSRD